MPHRDLNSGRPERILCGGVEGTEELRAGSDKVSRNWTQGQTGGELSGRETAYMKAGHQQRQGWLGERMANLAGWRGRHRQDSVA